MAELKTKPTDASVSDFLAQVTDEGRRQDCQTLLEMMQEITQAEPIMWGDRMVGFGRYKYHYATGNSGEWLLVGFAPRKTELTLYLMAGLDPFADLLAQLGKHKTGKGCLYVKRLADVDLTVLRELVTQTVARLAENRVDR